MKIIEKIYGASGQYSEAKVGIPVVYFLEGSCDDLTVEFADKTRSTIEHLGNNASVTYVPQNEGENVIKFISKGRTITDKIFVSFNEERRQKPSEERQKPSEDQRQKPSEDRYRPSEERRHKPSEDRYKPSEDRYKPSEDRYKPSEDQRPPPIMYYPISQPVREQNGQGAFGNLLSLTAAGVNQYYIHKKISGLKEHISWEGEDLRLNSVDDIILNPDPNVGVIRINSSLNSTNSNNGALVVLGGTGIGGNVNVGGTLNVTGTLTATGGMNSTAIGLVTPASGVFTTLTSNTGTATLNALNVTNNATVGTLTATGGMNSTAIGLVTPASGAFTTLTSNTGTATLNALNVTNNATVGTLLVTNGINSTPIGNSTPAAGVFTTLTGDTTVGGTLTASSIGYNNTVGGSITQASNGDRTPSVILNKLFGTITTNNASISASAGSNHVTFTVSNDKVSISDVIILVSQSGTDHTIATVSTVSNGSFNVTLLNVSNAADTTVKVLNFAVIKCS